MLGEIFAFSSALHNFIEDYEDIEGIKSAYWISKHLKTKISKIYSIFINHNAGYEIEDELK